MPRLTFVGEGTGGATGEARAGVGMTGATSGVWAGVLGSLLLISPPEAEAEPEGPAVPLDAAELGVRAGWKTARAGGGQSSTCDGRRRFPGCPSPSVLCHRVFLSPGCFSRLPDSRFQHTRNPEGHLQGALGCHGRSVPTCWDTGEWGLTAASPGEGPSRAQPCVRAQSTGTAGTPATQSTVTVGTPVTSSPGGMQPIAQTHAVPGLGSAGICCSGESSSAKTHRESVAEGKATIT